METMYRRAVMPAMRGPAYLPAASKGAAGAPSGFAPRMEEEGLDLRALGGLIGLLGQPESGSLPAAPAQFPEVEDALMAAQQATARISALPRF